MLTLKEALAECRDLWIEMRDANYTNHRDKDIILKNWKPPRDYSHNCPICEYTGTNCDICPLKEFWGRTSRRSYFCLALSSPYRPFEYGNGNSDLANEIVEECDRLLRELE